MATAYYLTENDLAILKQLVTRVRSGRGNTPNLPGQDLATGQAPEFYVARTPVGGIPALTEGNLDTGTGFDLDDIPGSATCDIYRVTNNGVSDVLTPIDTQRLVYCLCGQAVPGEKWVLVSRDKFGFWWVISCPPTTSTTTSTTTTLTCTGTCTWFWTTSDCKWHPSIQFCSSVCACSWPLYCGTMDCEHTTTICGPVGLPPACCGSTTTSTTTGTTTTCICIQGSPCVFQCEQGVWVFQSGTCLDACCECPANLDTGPVECLPCETISVNCIPHTTTSTTTTSTTSGTTTTCPATTTTTTPGSLCGYCTWVVFPGDTVWRLTQWVCQALSNCSCVYPPWPACNDSPTEPKYVQTYCVPGLTSTTTTSTTTTTGTTYPLCPGNCFWTFKSGIWVLTESSCTTDNCNCDRSAPTFQGVEDETATTSCTISGTTTTTTTTSTTTTTTTTVACSGSCFWTSFDGATWTLSSSTCSAGCNCANASVPTFIGQTDTTACV